MESKRNNRASTRNVRLSAIHSFFRYVGTQHPEHLAQTQRLLGIPFKRTETREIQHLEFAELQAVLDGIDRSAPGGRRDFTLLSLLFNTGARVSEMVGLQAADLRLAEPPSIRLRGKGSKERICPLWPETARLLLQLLEEQGIPLDRPEAVFRNRRGERLTRFGVGIILRKHVEKAKLRVPSLKHKRLHPHSLRHSTAVHLLRAGVDLSTISHWQALRLPHKIVMAHGSRIFCFVGPREHYDFHHVAETGVASPHTLKPRNTVTLAIEVSAQFCDNDHGFTEGGLVAVSFFLASSTSTSHSMGLKSTSHGSSGTSRPNRANNMIRQAITASMAMARSNTSAL